MTRKLVVIMLLCYAVYLIGINFTIGGAISSQWRSLVLYSFPTLMFFLLFVFSQKFEKNYDLGIVVCVFFILPMILGRLTDVSVAKTFAQEYFIFYDKLNYEIPFSYLYFFHTLLVSFGVSVVLNNLIKSKKKYTPRKVFSNTAGVFLLFYAVFIRARALGLFQSGSEVSFLSIILWFLPLAFPLFRFFETKRDNPFLARLLRLEHWTLGIVGIGSIFFIVEFFICFQPIHPIALWVAYAFFSVCVGVIIGYKIRFIPKDSDSTRIRSVLNNRTFWVFMFLLVIWTTINWVFAHASIYV